MTRDDIAGKLADEFSMSKATAKDVVKEVFGIIAAGLMKVGDKVEVAGFGNWKVTQANERNGVNPKTGEKLVIPAHAKLGFKASKTLKDGLK